MNIYYHHLNTEIAFSLQQQKLTGLFIIGQHSDWLLLYQI